MADRKIQVKGTNQWLVTVVGIVTGVALALSGSSPTGTTLADWLVLILAATAAVWASASAPWWALSGLAALAAALAPPVLPLLIGLGVFGLSLAIGAILRSQPVERAIVGGGALLTLSMARELHWFGINTLVAVAAVVVVGVLGLRRRSRADRRRAVIALAVVGIAAAVGVLGLFIAATSARPDLSEGNRVARQGLRELKAGDFDLAQSSFSRAADSFERADGDLGSLHSQPSRLVPLASQHRAAGARLSSAAALTTRTIEQQLRLIDFDELRIVDGRIDIEAVRGLQAPMQALQGALDDLERGVEAADSPWLIGRVAKELDELTVEIDEQQELGSKANEALAVAPAILGAEGERVYFVMFTTPAEARGQGGFMGNFAEITIDDGRITVTEFGRHTDLNRAGERPRFLENAPKDWLDRYAGVGFRYGPDGHVGVDPWSNITISPHFPYTAQVVSELYPKSGGRQIDGVFSMDVFALERLIDLVGPIDATDFSEPLTGKNSAQYLLVDQYEINETASNAVRRDQLEVIADETIRRFLGTNPPDPLELGKTMAPMAQERRLVAWLDDPAEESLLERIGMTGALLPNLNGRDGYAVTVVNDGASKMDTYLERLVSYTETENGDEISLMVTHDPPVAALPEYVVGFSVGVPPGWARLWLTVYSTRATKSATLNGEPVDVGFHQEAGLYATSVFVEAEPGVPVEFTLQLAPSTAAEPNVFLVDPQPLVRPERWAILGSDPVEVDVSTQIVLPSTAEG